MKNLTPRLLASTALVACGLIFSTDARAQQAPAAPVAAPAADEAPKPAPLVFSPEWAEGIKFGVQVEGGIVFNTASPRNGINFGQLFTDRSNQATLNQVAITLGRAIDPKTTGFDIGFKVQAMYGSDARYTQYLGVFGPMGSRYQVDLTEANVTMRLPVLTAGGIDIKAGLYSTPMGLETIDPSTNPFYSHSYIFNYGLPLKHTGLYTITHVNDVVDLHLGVDTGINTTWGFNHGDNNKAAAFLGGIGLNLMEGKLTVLALTHIGPENAVRAIGSVANNRLRYSNDILITYKPSDTLSFTTELNLIRDDFAKANAGGIAQYVSYAVSDTWTLNGRAEVFRDDKGFFVGGYRTNSGPYDALAGLPFNGFVGTTRGTTYGALTLGGTWKPKFHDQVSTFMIRPEVRYDQAFTSNRPFSGRSNALTLAADLVIGF